MPQRIDSHVIEEKAINNVRSIFAGSDFIFRNVEGRDYGVDAIIEYFESGFVTGKIAFVQIKGTSDKISPLKRWTNRISCSISTSNGRYALQKNIPVILVYNSLNSPESLFYECLQNSDISLDKLNSQKSITIHINKNHMISDDVKPIVEIIQQFYK